MYCENYTHSWPGMANGWSVLKGTQGTDCGHCGSSISSSLQIIMLTEYPFLPFSGTQLSQVNQTVMMLLCVVTSVPVGLWCTCRHFWNPAPGDITIAKKLPRAFLPLFKHRTRQVFTHAAVCSQTQPGMCVYMCACPRAQTHASVHTHTHTHKNKHKNKHHT